MRIYQVLVIGSFVALSACKTNDADTANVAPVAEQTPANDRGEPSAEKQESAVDANGRPIGATDPIRVPTP